MTDIATAPTTTRRVRADATDPLEALLVAAGPHVVPVLDVGRTAGGDLLLVLPEPRARLTPLLDVPGWPGPGEAVTVLVPLAQALARAHSSGVAFGVAGADAIVLDAEGSPAWDPPAPVLLRRVGPAAFSLAVDEDLSRFAALAEGVVARAGLRLEARGRPLGEVVGSLFDLADPEPVRLHPGAPLERWGAPSRLVPPLADALDEPARAGLRLPVALRSVRSRVWVAAGAVAVALVAALLVLPGGDSSDAAGRSAPSRGSSPAGATGGGGAPTRAALTGVPSAGATRAGGPAAPRSLAPADAVRRLLAGRAVCLAHGDAACLDRVVAAGSPVRALDRAAIVSGAEPLLPPDRRPRVLSTGGATATAAVGRTVVVAVRQTDGWRLRDVVAEPPG